MNKTLVKSKKTGLMKSRTPIPPTRVETSKKHKKEKHKKNFRDLISEDSSIIYKFIILDKNFNPLHYAWGYDENDVREIVRELFPEFITVNGKILDDKDLYFVQTLEYKII